MGLCCLYASVVVEYHIIICRVGYDSTVYRCSHRVMSMVYTVLYYILFLYFRLVLKPMFTRMRAIGAILVVLCVRLHTTIGEFVAVCTLEEIAGINNFASNVHVYVSM